MDLWIAVRLAVVIQNQLWRGSASETFLRCESATAKQQFILYQAKVGTYPPSTTSVTLKIEMWASGGGMMKDGDGAPIDVQLSICKLSRIDAEAPNVAGDD